MAARWPIGDRAGRHHDDTDFNWTGRERLQHVARRPGRRFRQDGRPGDHRFGQTGGPRADRSRPRLCPNAASDVLTKGDKDSSQPWENPETGARGSVTPLARAYFADGHTCRDFLASYVNGSAENWLQGAACKSEQGRWEIHTLKPWTQG